uniref:BED-type domain-containing protein n=1 Tax=Plectus sambesii TaxID=2011161 RepID=A0A914VF59_9BILA
MSKMTRENASWVWDGHATKFFQGEAQFAQCSYCPSQISCAHSSTRGIASHLKSQHNVYKDESQRAISLLAKRTHQMEHHDAPKRLLVDAYSDVFTAASSFVTPPRREQVIPSFVANSSGSNSDASISSQLLVRMEERERQNSHPSWVWQHATKMMKEDAQFAQCNYCHSLLSCAQGSTRGIGSHLKSQHNICKDNAGSSEQDIASSSSLGQFFSNTSSSNSPPLANFYSKVPPTSGACDSNNSSLKQEQSGTEGDSFEDEMPSLSNPSLLDGLLHSVSRSAITAQIVSEMPLLRTQIKDEIPEVEDSGEDHSEAPITTTFFFSDGHIVAELVKIAGDSDLAITIRNNEYCFTANSEGGGRPIKSVAFKDLGDVISVLERVNSEVVKAERWIKADWAQFACALRWKCHQIVSSSSANH